MPRLTLRCIETKRTANGKTRLFSARLVGTDPTGAKNSAARGELVLTDLKDDPGYVVGQDYTLDTPEAAS